MPVPQSTTAHAELLDRRFSKIFDGAYKNPDEKRSTLFTVQTARKGADEKMSNIGELGDLVPYTGSFTYDSTNQGYEVTATHKEYGKAMSITRTMRDDDLFSVMDKQPAKLGRATDRTLENFGARIFTMAFSNDTLFYVHSEGVPLCSNSHTTRSPGVSTAVGFDNLGVSALSATAVSAYRIQMRQFRGDRAERLSIRPNELWVPVDLEDTAYEITNSMGKLDTANNNVNAQQGRWSVHVWDYMSDANDWFMCDSMMRKENLFWWNRIAPEFAKTGDFDTMDWKWRVYVRFSYNYNGWRWVMGSQVS